MRPKNIRIKRSDTSFGLYNVLAPDYGQNKHLRFRDRPSTSSKPYFNLGNRSSSYNDISMNVQELQSNEDVHVMGEPLLFLRKEDSTPLVQEGINEETLYSIKRSSVVSRSSKVDLTNSE